MRNFWVAFVVLLSIAGGVLFGDMGSKVDERAVKSAQLAQFKDLSGNWRRLSDWDGSYRIVNFWATWCTPCLKEIPAFVKFYKENSEYVEILGLDFEPVNIEVINDFIERFNINYPIVLYDHRNDSEYSNFGEILGMPTTQIFSPEGELLQTFMGEVTIEDLNKFIKPIT